MKPFAILSFLFALGVPALAGAQDAAPTISIALGETVTVRIADNPAGFVVLSRGRAPAQGETTPPRAEDTVRFTFTEAGGMKMLSAENGYARAFDYRARMFNGRRSANTSICTVMPRIIGFESWGDPIDRLELREPRLSEGGGMSCQ